MKKSSQLDPSKPEHNISRINEISVESGVFNKVFEDGSPFFTRIEFSITDLCNRVCEFCPRVDPEVYPNNNEEISTIGYDNEIFLLQQLEVPLKIINEIMGIL